MNPNRQYKVHCDCRATELTLKNEPIVHAYCHCQDCRELLDSPFHIPAAWTDDNAQVSRGKDNLIEYSLPGRKMKRYCCKHCGTTLFNTNMYDWTVISQVLFRKCHNNELPDELTPNKHFFYSERMVDIEDQLPKFLRGTDGPLFEET